MRRAAAAGSPAARTEDGSDEARGLKQIEAADLLGITTPDVSDLVRGKLARYSMQRLERLLNPLDMDARIQVGRTSAKERAGISVESVGRF